MNLNTKRCVSLLMSALIISQNAICNAEAQKSYKTDKGLSLGEKIKYNFCALKDKIKKNPKKSVLIGGGIGLGALLLLLLGIRPWKNKKVDAHDKEKNANISSHDNSSVPKHTNVTLDADSASKSQHSTAMVTDLNSEKSNTTPNVQKSDVISSESNPKIDSDTALNPHSVSNPVSTSISIANPEVELKENTAPKCTPEPKDDMDCELDPFFNSTLLGEPSSDKKRELESEVEDDSIDDFLETMFIDSESPGIVSDDKKEMKVEVERSSTERVTPRSSLPEERIELSEELRISFDSTVDEAIHKFCECQEPYRAVKKKRDFEKVKSFIEFLVKIRNDLYNPKRDLTSIFEQNATRCWQRVNKFAVSKNRGVEEGALRQFIQLAEACNFVNGVVNLKSSQGITDWKLFMESLLRNISVVTDSLDPNAKLLKMKLGSRYH